MMAILDTLQGPFGDLTRASAGAKLMEAFGEGAQVIDALAKHTDRLRNGITLVLGADDEPDPALPPLTGVSAAAHRW